MFSLIKKMFKKDTEYSDNSIDDYEITDYIKPSDIDDSVSNFDWSTIPEPEVRGNLDSKQSFMLMDDLADVFFLYEIDFANIKKLTGYDIEAEFKIIKCGGDDAGFIAQKYLANSTDELVVALLDITLGKVVKLRDGNIITYDGVDIGLEIMRIQPNCCYKFCTAHRLDKKNSELLKFISKFETATGLDISDYYFSKNANRVEEIIKLLRSVGVKNEKIQ